MGWMSRSTMRLSFGLALAAGVGAAGNAAVWTPWDFRMAQEVSNPVTAPTDLIPGTTAKFIWYGDSSPPLADDAPPYLAQFQWATHDTPVSAIAKIIADDFFALYVGGVLVPGAYAWLDDLPTISGTIFHEPLTVDLTGILTSPLQFFQVFTCDGFAPDPRIAPPVNLDDADAVCPNPSSRGSHYLLFDLAITARSAFDDALYIVHEVSGAGWDARTRVDVIEPSTIAVLGGATMALAWARRSRRSSAGDNIV